MNPTLINESPLLASVNWIAQLLTGSIGIAIAALAIATIGLAMLLGRLSPRDGARVIIGTFILLGAPILAIGLVALAPNGAPVRHSRETFATQAPHYDTYSLPRQNSNPYELPAVAR